MSNTLVLQSCCSMIYRCDRTVMDNINLHKTAKVKALIESVGCKILYLPTYSPDLNPIEHYWFKIKHQIRKIAGDFKDFFVAVEHGISLSIP